MVYTRQIDHLKLFYFLIVLALPFKLYTQVTQGFEGISTALDCGNSSCYYTDPGSAEQQHLLTDNNNVVVSVEGEGDSLGFITEFFPTRTGASGADGLTDGDAFGVGGSVQLSSEHGFSAPEGSQAFLMQDTDGLVVMYFDYVDLSDSLEPAMSLQYFLSETTWERSSGQNDRFYARLEIDNCASTTTVHLLDTDGGGPAGNSEGDIDDLQIEGSWNILDQDLSPYIGCRAQLIIEFDSNASAESLGLDQIFFTEGSRQSYDPGTTAPKLLIEPSSIELSLMQGQTAVMPFAVKSEDNGSSADEVSIQIIDLATGTGANWATTISAATLDKTYEVTLNSEGLSTGTYLAILKAGSIDGYEDVQIPITLVVEERNLPVVQQLILVDADSGNDIKTLNNGLIIDITDLPTLQLSVRAETSNSSQSVFMQISGAINNERFENVMPYALFGNRGSKYSGRIFSPGTYSLRIIPYSEDHGQGTMGDILELEFQILVSESQPGFSLLNAADDTEIFPLTNGAIIDKNVLGDLEFGVIFNSPIELKGVRFKLSGPLNYNQKEGSMPPYSLFGDIGSDIQGKNLPPGLYNLVAKPNNGEEISLQFNVVEDLAACTAFILVDADTNTDLMEINDGSVINKSMLSSNRLNIKVLTKGQVGSVQLQLTGALRKERIENIEPYSLFGDYSGDYVPGSLPDGSYSLTATPYSGNRLKGTKGRTLTINFTVNSDNGGALKLYPNPANTEIQVKVVDSKTEAEVFTIQVHDMQGQLIRSYTSKEISGKDQFLMPTYSMQSGVYIMTVIGSEGTLQKKTFVVNK